MCDWGNPDPGPTYWEIMQAEKRMTICDRVRRLLSDGKARTCMQILHSLGDPCNSDSLSSSLLKMGRKGELEMIPNFGPRGGRGYRKKG